MRERSDTRFGRWAIAACLLAAVGCASEDTQSALHKVTPSFMLSDQDKAERQLKDPEALHLAYGKFQEQVGQSVEARKSYEAALRDDPQSVDAVLGLARLDQLADHPKDAETGFQKALRLKPGDPKVLASLGQFYVSQKRWPDAFQSLNAAIAAAPGEAFYKHELAVAKTASGDVSAGLALFSQLVGPDKAHYNVAYILRREGKTEDAVRQCQITLTMNPNFEPAKTMLAQIHEGLVAQSRGPSPRGANPSSPSAVTASAVGTSNQPVSGASQASWQPPAKPAPRALPVTESDSMYDTPTPPGSTATSDRSASSSGLTDPWAH
ncbi:MAG TPA: tetratricopeptide repeat protein [Planctomycetaceae bacterium]|jgi:tetratricopeptide (TPR) repeat protein|nr:tetratricopeptide repeat protein [Planctomycetaceae bacterium]